MYEAVLPEKPFFKAGSLDGNVKGSIVAITAPDGKGVEFKVRFSNLPKEGGPFSESLLGTTICSKSPSNPAQPTTFTSILFLPMETAPRPSLTTTPSSAERPHPAMLRSLRRARLAT